LQDYRTPRLGAAPFLTRDVRAEYAAEVDCGPAGAAGLSAAILD